jgi:3-hydroxyacyl-CoA dehydrogenase, NAD binding domain
MASTRGGEVCLFDPHQRSLDAGLTYVTETLPAVVASFQGATAGRVRGETDLGTAVRNAWLVVEAVSEQLNLKRTMRDLIVDRRIHKVYLYAFPLLVLFQIFCTQTYLPHLSLVGVYRHCAPAVNPAPPRW